MLTLRSSERSLRLTLAHRTHIALSPPQKYHSPFRLRVTMKLVGPNASPVH